MRILHIVQNYHPSLGGLQWMVKNLSEEMVTRYGDEVTVFTTNALLNPPSSVNTFLPPGREMVNGVAVHRFPFSRAFTWAYRFFRRGMRKIGFTFPDDDLLSTLSLGPLSGPMMLALWRAEFDVIASTPANYLHTIYPLIFNKSRQTPVVIIGALHLHDSAIPAPALWAIRRANAYVALTTFERDTLTGCGIHPEKIYVIGPGVDVDRFESGDGSGVRERFGFRNDPVIGFIGRQTQYKGIETLIDAMKIVWGQFPDARLLIAGKETAYTAVLRQRIDAEPEQVRNRIALRSGIDADEIADYYAACDVFVSVSSQESFGIVYLEAWASKKPVVAARIGAVESLVRPRIDGLLVDYGDAPGLAEQLVHLISDASERTRMGLNGYERVREEFTWQRAAQKLHEIYEQVIEK